MSEYEIKGYIRRKDGKGRTLYTKEFSVCVDKPSDLNKAMETNEGLSVFVKEIAEEF